MTKATAPFAAAASGTGTSSAATMTETRQNGKREQENGHDEDENGHDEEIDAEIPSSSLGSFALISFLMGLLLASATAFGVYMFRETFPDDSELLASFPQVTYAQCMILCGVTILLLAIYAFHLNQQLNMISMDIPIVENSFSSLPYFGQAPLFLTNSPWDLLLRWHRQYGPVFVFVLMGRTCVSVAHPEYLKVALQSKIRNVKKDVAFSYKPFLVILGKGIVSSENQSWMKQRLKMSTALRMDVLDIIPGITLQAVQRLYATFDVAADTGTKVELAESLRHLTLQVISSSFLSLSADESDSTFAQMYLPIVDECNKRVWHPERAYMFFMPFFWKHFYHVYRLNSYVSSLIWKRWEERQSSKERRGDMLDRVLDTYEKENPGQDLTKAAAEQFRDEMKTFMLAGHETSAAMMSWALYELIGDKELMKEVVTEAQGVFGEAAKSDWKELGTSSLPPREELSNLVTAEGCLKVHCVDITLHCAYNCLHSLYTFSNLSGGVKKVCSGTHGDSSGGRTH